MQNILRLAPGFPRDMQKEEITHYPTTVHRKVQGRQIQHAATASGKPYRNNFWKHNENIKTRIPIHYKVKWNGKLSAFSVFKGKYESWLYQSGQYYVLNPSFKEQYMIGGWDAACSYAPDISRNQFAADKMTQFGALLSCCSSAYAGRRYLYQHHEDGLMVWYKFMNDYGGKANMVGIVDKLETQLNTPWHEAYKGGIAAYLDMVATAYNRLDAEDPDGRYHEVLADRIKMHVIYSRFASTSYSTLVSTMYRDAKDKGKTFDEFLLDIKNEDEYLHGGAHHYGRLNTRVLKNDPQAGNDLGSEIFEKRLASYYIGNKAFKLLTKISPTVMKQFIRLRRQAQCSGMKGTQIACVTTSHPRPGSRSTVTVDHPEPQQEDRDTPDDQDEPPPRVPERLPPPCSTTRLAHNRKQTALETVKNPPHYDLELATVAPGSTSSSTQIPHHDLVLTTQAAVGNSPQGNRELILTRSGKEIVEASEPLLPCTKINPGPRCDPQANPQVNIQNGHTKVNHILRNVRETKKTMVTPLAVENLVINDGSIAVKENTPYTPLGRRKFICKFQRRFHRVFNYLLLLGMVTVIGCEPTPEIHGNTWGMDPGECTVHSNMQQVQVPQLVSEVTERCARKCLRSVILGKGEKLYEKYFEHTHTCDNLEVSSILPWSKPKDHQNVFKEQARRNTIRVKMKS